MTTQLPERLRALADEAPAALSAGRPVAVGTRHGIGVACSPRVALAACLVVAVALLGARGPAESACRNRRHHPRRAGADGDPERFFHPSPWLPGTSSPGRLVAMLGTTRDHFPFGSDLGACAVVTRRVRRPTTSSTCPDQLRATTSSCLPTVVMSRTSWRGSLAETQPWVAGRSSAWEFST